MFATCTVFNQLSLPPLPLLLLPPPLPHTQPEVASYVEHIHWHTTIISNSCSGRHRVLNPSFAGAQPRGVPNLSAHVACEAFSLAFGLSSPPAFALAFPLGLFNGPSCFLGLRPRLSVARRILFLRCALPLASRGGFLGPLTLFTFSFALTLRGRVERFNNYAQRLCELLDGAGVTPSFARFFREADVISLSFSWSTSGGR